MTVINVIMTYNITKNNSQLYYKKSKLKLLKNSLV